MEKIFIRPAAGIRLFNPATKNMVPDGGVFVEKNQYWSRRVTEGGAVIFDPRGAADRAEIDRKTIAEIQAAAQPSQPAAPEAPAKHRKQK